MVFSKAAVVFATPDAAERVPPVRENLHVCFVPRTRRSASLPAIVAARAMLPDGAPEFVAESWGLDTLSGRFVEFSGTAATAALSASAALILEAQRRGELAAWIAARESTFYPPDFAASGIDLAALPVIHAPDALKAARAADTLLRSGGFAMIVIDLGTLADLSIAVQTRLAGLAKKHRTALVCITRHNDRKVSPGSLVSLRSEIEKKRDGFDRFLCETHVIKDKQRTPGWRRRELCRGPDGLC